MRFKHFIFSLLLLATAITAAAQMPAQIIPADTAFRVGRLSNGLTYYIRYNNWPEHRANFYIAQKVGSIEENDDQRGLAHFLEHMAFNGSDHFKGNDLIEWCRAHGIKFGGDLNAYTSTDETVYNIDNVPTTNAGTIDSCLLILRDWSTGLSLEQSEIEKERGVIHEEWRLRTSPSSRMLERNLEKLYPGSKYGQRFPIGLMSIVDNFKRKELVDYYRKWYHPDHQGIIVVGDVDVNKTEAQIKKLFGNITNPAHEAPLVVAEVPDNVKPIVVIDKDKEQQNSFVLLMIKHDVYPDSLKQQLSYFIENYAKEAAVTMLNARFTEAAQQADCPFVMAHAEEDGYLLSKTKDAFSLNIAPKDISQTAEALKAAIIVARQAAEYGFTATEYDRYKTNMLSNLEKKYSNRDKQTNANFVSLALDNFLHGEAMPSIEFSYPLMKQIVPAIPLEGINQLLPQLISKSDSNLVIVNFNNEKEGNVYPTEAQLLQAINEGRQAQIVAFVDNVKNEPIIKKLPKAGKIKKETYNKLFDYSILKLSNGVTVLLKKTDYKKDQVILTGMGGSGQGNYGKADFANIHVFDNVIDYSGLGDFSTLELSKALAGKIADVHLQMDDRRMSIKGNSTPTDVETMLQLTYLCFTSIRKDVDAFNNLMQLYEVGLQNREQNPEIAFSDSLTRALYDNSWRYQPFLKDDVKNVNYDRILDMARERTANANDWTFEVIGNYNDSTIRQLICQYLGALPSKGKNPKGLRTVTPTNKNVDIFFTRKMETPKANTQMVWLNHATPYTLEKSLQANIAGQILKMVYLKKIREEASAAYSCGVQGAMSIADDGFHIAEIEAACPMKPEKKDTVIRIMNEEMQNLARTCDADMLAKVQKYMLKQYENAIKSNDYWRNIVWRNYTMNEDNHTMYKHIIESQTPQTISNFVKEFLSGANKVSVVMMPNEDKN